MHEDQSPIDRALLDARRRAEAALACLHAVEGGETIASELVFQSAHGLRRSFRVWKPEHGENDVQLAGLLDEVTKDHSLRSRRIRRSVGPRIAQLESADHATELEASARALIKLTEAFSERLAAERGFPTLAMQQRRLAPFAFAAAIAAALGYATLKPDGLLARIRNRITVGDVRIDSWTQGWGQLNIGRGPDGTPLRVNGRPYEQGIGTHAASSVKITLLRSGTNLTGGCAYPDAAHGTSIVCTIWASGKQLFATRPLSDQQRAESFSVPLSGETELELRIDSANGVLSHAHGAWIDLTVTN